MFNNLINSLKNGLEIKSLAKLWQIYKLIIIYLFLKKSK